MLFFEVREFDIMVRAFEIVSGMVGAIITYILAALSRRLELLYHHKIPAFQEIQTLLTDYKLELESNVYGSDFPGRTPDAKGSVATVRLLEHAYLRNSKYFSKNGREAIMDLVGKIDFLCSLELTAVEENLKIERSLYVEMTIEVSKVIEILYKDLKVK